MGRKLSGRSGGKASGLPGLAASEEMKTIKVNRFPSSRAHKNLIQSRTLGGREGEKIVAAAVLGGVERTEAVVSDSRENDAGNGC